jgi:hypothetical protein
VTLTSRSSLAEMAILVGDALRRAGVRAVLTGGACANVYAAGAHVSHDADFVLPESTEAVLLDRALGELGFRRERDHYVHPRTPFIVEFPPGPLGIGEDFGIRPVWLRRRGRRSLALSATDSCRDRLAAFYHWADRQSLAVAVQIAVRHRVAMARIREWSRSEGHEQAYDEFVRELARRRARRARSRPEAVR